MHYEHIKIQDPEVYGAMMRELGRQRDHIELIASENFVSPAVMEAMGSHLTNRAGQKALWCRTCQCPAPLRLSGQHGGVPCPAQAR